MARVQVAAQPWGLLYDGSSQQPKYAGSQTPVLTTLSGGSVTTYAAATGSTTTALTSDSHGTLQGWVEEGTYTFTLAGTSVTVEAISGRTLGWVNVRSFGAKGDGTTDDTAAIQAAINSLTSGGVVYFPPGDYGIIAGLTVGAEVPLFLRGAGMPHNSSTFAGTRLKRLSGTATVLAIAGSAAAVSARVEVTNMELNGGSTAGTVLATDRLQNANFHWLYIHSATGSGWKLRQVYNSRVSNIYFQSCGGSGAAALLFDAFAETQGGCDGVQFSNIQFLASGGTDIKMTGDSGSSSPTTSIVFSNVRLEGGSSAATPYIDLDYARASSFSNVFITNSGTAKSVPFIQQVGSTSLGQAANQFANLYMEGQAGGTSLYFIQVGRSSFAVKNWAIVSNFSLTALMRIDSTVSAGRVSADDPITSSNAPVFSDARALPEYPKTLNGSKTFDFPSVADAASTTTTVTVTGAVLGMQARAWMSLAVPAGVVLTASVTAADTVSVTLFNKSGGAVDLASGTLFARAGY